MRAVAFGFQLFLSQYNPRLNEHLLDRFQVATEIALPLNMPDNDMGNTITTSTSSVVPFSPPDPTSKSGSAVLFVQKSSDLDFSPSDEDKTKKKTAVLVAHVHAPSRTATTEKNAVVATNGNSGSQVLSAAEKNANGDDHAMSDDNDHILIYTDDEKKETTSNALVPIQKRKNT